MPSLTYKTVASYDQILPMINGRCNEPEITGRFTPQSFEAEYDAVYDALVTALEAVGEVAEGSSKGDFSMNRYVPIERSITIAITSERGMSLAALEAIAAVLRRCRIAYIVRLDVHAAYVFICRDGSVFGCGSPEILKRFGFPD